MTEFAFTLGFFTHMPTELRKLPTQRPTGVVATPADPLAYALQAAGMMAWDWDPTTDVVTQSENVAEVLGLPPGQTISTGSDFFALIYAPDRPRVLAALRAALRGGASYQQEFRLVRGDGSLMWVADRGRIVPRLASSSPRMSGVLLDITPRKIAEEALRASEQRFRAFTENAWDGVVVISSEGEVTYVSPAVSSILGYEIDNLLGRHVFDYVHPDDLPQAVNVLAGVLLNAALKPRVTYRFHHADGSWRWIEASAVNLLGDPAVRGIVANFRDITEQQIADAEHREAAELLRATSAQLAEADRRKDEFLATLAHELRNPLAPIRHAVEFLSIDGASGPDHDFACQVVLGQTEQLTRLVDDLLDISRIGRDKLRLAKQRVALAGIVQRAVETTQPLFEAAAHVLDVQLPRSEVWLEADPTRLAQVIGNLLANAAKYTSRGGKIELSVNCWRDAIEIAVSDNGIGIEPEMLSQIFEMFKQVDTALDRSQGGLGIGLTIVKTLVEMHGGTVRAASDGKNLGSTFTVRLPR